MKNKFVESIFVPDIEPRKRHKLIFKTFMELQAGEYMELTVDHDPKPLYYQFLIEREGEFDWQYLEEGPEKWRVAIGKK